MGNCFSRKKVDINKIDRNDDKMGTTQTHDVSRYQKVNTNTESKFSYQEVFDLMRNELSRYVNNDLIELILEYIPRCIITDEITPVSPFDTHRISIQVLSSNNLLPMKFGHSFAINQPLCQCGSVLNMYPNKERHLKCDGFEPYQADMASIKKIIPHQIYDIYYYQCMVCHKISCTKCAIMHHTLKTKYPSYDDRPHFAKINQDMTNIGDNIWDPNDTKLNELIFYNSNVGSYFSRRLQLAYSEEYMRIYYSSSKIDSTDISEYDMNETNIIIFIDDFRQSNQSKWAPILSELLNINYENIQKIYLLHGLTKRNKLSISDKHFIKKLSKRNKLSIKNCNIIDPLNSFTTLMDIIGEYISQLSSKERESLKPKRHIY